MNHLGNVALTAIGLAFALALVGCSGNESEVPPTTEASDSWQLTDIPTDATTVAEVKTSASPGDTVTVRGRIGGRMDPLTPESGLFILVDTEIPICSEIPGDTCPTPWDYCCEPREILAAHSATVQVRDANGQPIDLSDALEPTQEIVVAGTVASNATPEAFVIHATGIAMP